MDRILPCHLISLLMSFSLALAVSADPAMTTDSAGAAASTPSTAAPADAPQPIHVAIVDDSDGGAEGPKNLLLILTRDAGFDAARVTSAQVRDGVLAEQAFDVVIFPGGSGSGQARRLKDAGAKNIRAYVANGGGYVGFCAGSYLASSSYKWSLNLINAKTVDPNHWARGTGMVTLDFTPAGREALDQRRFSGVVYYGQGPLLAPGDNPDLPPYEQLATYATEIARKGAPSGVMIGTTAIARAPYHRGRVLCFSPHPEKKNGLHYLVINAVRWAAGRGSDD